VCRRSRQRAGSSGAISHQTAAPRAHFDRVDHKIFECVKPVHPRICPPPGSCAGGSASRTKSALDSRSCSCFCPAAAVDTTRPHDRLEKAQKMHKFNKFGVTSPLHQARWHSRRVHREVPAEHARGSGFGRRGRVIDEVSGQIRTHVDGFGMQQSPRLCATTLSASGKGLANSSLRVGSKATWRHRTSLSPRSGMGVAVIFAMRVADPSAQPGQEEAE
jgi:hypothetical protein